jgi:3'(2'), 5'-bisphosphate nucleotidase
MNNYQRELDAALEAVRQASQLLVQLYDRFQVVPDAPADITTDADRRSQEIILDHLHRVFPQDALCAEETTPHLASVPQTGPRLWVVDPIDGTRGFARKNGEFSIMVGFVDRGQVALGIVQEPALRRLTYAVRGGGCYRRDGDETTDSVCRVSTVADLAAATVTQSRSQKASAPSRQILALKPARTLELYSAGIKLARVARGEADIYLNNYANFHDWDICAGHILVDKAGGKATGLGGQELRYGEPGAPQAHGLLASNGLLHAAALRALEGCATPG